MKLRSLALTGALATVAAMSAIAFATPALAAPDDDPPIVLIPGTQINVCAHLDVSTVDQLVDQLDLAAALETTVRASLPNDAALVSLKGTCVRVSTSPSASTPPTSTTSAPPKSTSHRPRPMPADLYDCDDFPLRDGTTAQQKLQEDRRDPHKLDEDSDGIACEALPRTKLGTVIPDGYPNTGGTEPMPGDVVVG